MQYSFHFFFYIWINFKKRRKKPIVVLSFCGYVLLQKQILNKKEVISICTIEFWIRFNENYEWNMSQKSNNRLFSTKLYRVKYEILTWEGEKILQRRSVFFKAVLIMAICVQWNACYTRKSLVLIPEADWCVLILKTACNIPSFEAILLLGSPPSTFQNSYCILMNFI